MIKIISRNTTEMAVSYVHNFENKRGSGYCFPVIKNKDGEFIHDYKNMEILAQQSLKKCLYELHKTDMKDYGIKEHKSVIKIPSIGECLCGKHVRLSGFTNKCSCGRMYNWAGQELAPVEQWGEETGEDSKDILMIK